jgi:hypothetical protein
MPSISQWPRLRAHLLFRRVDERIYAAVRIAFAAVALLNLISLWPDRQVLFSDAGMIDHDLARSQASPVYLSIFALARGELAVTGCLLFTGVALVMLMTGVGTRPAALWALVWHVSYTARSPLSNTGWDLVLRCFSFLVLVSPAGKCWSLPALIRGCGSTIPAFVSCHGLMLMRLQVLVIYWQAVLRRLVVPDPYWVNGEFLSYFMLSHYARWPGRWVLDYEGFLAFGTYAIQIAELAIPVLLWVKKTRWWGFLLGFAMHAGISIFVRDLGLFFLSMMMTYLAFLRAEDVEGLERLLKRRFTRAGQRGND